MKILFLHGWTSVPGGVKPTYLKEHGHTVLNPKLPDDDFSESVRIAEAEYDKHQKRIEHAWCKRGDLVVDLAMPIPARVIDRQQYYRLIRPEVSRRYSAGEALFLSIKTGHQGPWGESEQLKEQRVGAATAEARV